MSRTLRLVSLALLVLAGVSALLFAPDRAERSGALLRGDPLPAEGHSREGALAGDLQSARPPAARSETSADGRGAALPLRVRAEHYLGGEGLPGARFELSSDGQLLASATTGPDGRATLPARGSTQADVEPPAGYWVQRLLERETAAGPLLVARLAPDTHGPLRALLVDAAAGDPLPAYILRLASPEGWTETLESDAEGRLESQVLFPAGTLELRSTEEECGHERGGWTLARIDFQPAGAEPPLLRIPIEVGPIYELSLRGWEGRPLAHLSAHLISEDWAWEIDAEVDPGARVREGERPWVRFSEDLSWLDSPRLVLLGPNGRWRGVASVDAGSGRHPSPVPITLERLATVRARVLDGKGAELARAELELEGLMPGGLLRWGSSNGRGRVAFEGLPAGSYALRAVHPTGGSLETRLDLGLGQELERELVLEPYEDGGEVSGVVRSESGTFAGTCVAILTPRGESGAPRRTQSLGWQRVGGSLEARFRFLAVAREDYELRLALPRDAYEVSPALLELSPPELGADFVIEDSREVFRLTFYPVDATTGRWLGEAHLVVRGEGGALLYEGTASGWESPRAFAEEEELTWRLSKPGYITERGDRAAFTARGRAHLRTAVVRLRRN